MQILLMVDTEAIQIDVGQIANCDVCGEPLDFKDKENPILSQSPQC
jgi:hypothetical protein